VINQKNIFPCSLVAVAALLAAIMLVVAPVRAEAQTTVRGVDPALSDLLARCAPTVHPETMAAVISAESRGHQFAIADAGPVNMPWSKRKALVRSIYPGSLDEAVGTAKALIADGHTVSLGMAQVNDRNLAGLGVTLKDVFDPCTNVHAGGQILTDFYEKAAHEFGPGITALRAALSAYNSGDWVRGAKDGYVDRVYQQRGKALSISTQRLATGAHGAPKAQPPRGEERKPAARPFTLDASSFSLAEMN
jgi:type IV secretion system protein VirB1